MLRSFSINDIYMLLTAMQWTLALSGIALVGGGIFGLAIAFARASDVRPLRWVAAVFILLFQGTPLLMQLFLVYFGAAVFGLDINVWLAAAIGLTLHASAFLGEIWRGCIQAIGKGQSEAAVALSLGYVKRMRYVVVPQAAKIASAPTVGFLVQLIKGTSLTALIGFVELTRAGQIINNNTFQPFLVFGLVGAGYFILCWPISMAAGYLENRYAVNGHPAR